MNKIIRYSGIAALSVTLIMMSLGSMPQTYAGTVPSTLTVNIGCGAILTGAFTFGGGILVGAVLTQAENTVGQPQIQNTGVAQSQISVGVGTDSSTGPGGGGYKGNTDGITHIAAGSIKVDVGEGLVTMVSAASTSTGVVNAGSTDNIDVSVTVTLINPGSTDADWVATYTFTVTDCLLVVVV